MKIVLNYKKGNHRLKEGLELAGHAVTKDIWDIKEIIAAHADAVIFEFKYIFKEKLRFLSLAHKLKKHRIPAITWNLDAPWNGGIKTWKVNTLLKSSLLSIYASHSLQDTGWIKKPMVLYLPNAAWTSRYNLREHTLEDLKRPDFYKWDVSFIGNIDRQRYKEHTERVEFLDALGNYLKNRGINFLFIDSSGLSYDEQVAVIQKSRINLSCLSAADSTQNKSWGLPERCYGIPACGGFLLMENRVHIKDDFTIDEEVMTYSGIQDCKDRIFYYLDRHEERRKIAEKAYERVMKEHTYKHRAEKLISKIQNLKNDVNLKKN